tara:strand:+ start:825 stop:2042 length:1218 start_codon:yes stop_codon:yes gene_type:complete
MSQSISQTMSQRKPENLNIESPKKRVKSHDKSQQPTTEQEAHKMHKATLKATKATLEATKATNFDVVPPSTNNDNQISHLLTSTTSFVDSPFELYCSRKSLESFLKRISTMLDKIVFQINSQKKVLEIKVIHPSGSCAIWATFQPMRVKCKPNVKQPLICVNTKALLSSCELKIDSTVAKIVYDEDNGQLIMSLISDKANLQVYTNVMNVEGDLPQIEIAKQSSSCVLHLPLNMLKAGIGLSKRNQGKSVTLSLLKKKQTSKGQQQPSTIYYFLMQAEDNSSLHIHLNQTINTAQSTSQIIHLTTSEELESNSFDNQSLQNYDTIIHAGRFNVTYIQGFLSSIKGSNINKTLEIRIGNDAPLLLEHEDILFALSGFVDEGDNVDNTTNDTNDTSATNGSNDTNII